MAEKKYDVKKKENGKWTVVDSVGKIYPNAGEFKTEKEAVERLREMAGHKAHKEEPKGYKHKKSEVINQLIVLADKLDNLGSHREAEEIDNLLKEFTK